MSLLRRRTSGKADARCQDNVSDDTKDGCGLSALVDVVELLSRDGVTLFSVLNGVPHDDHDALVEELKNVLVLATAAAPADAARVIAALLLTEFDCATRRRNDVHTFMRGNSIAPRVIEGLLMYFARGLGDSLALCCDLLGDKPESERTRAKDDKKKKCKDEKKTKSKDEEKTKTKNDKKTKTKDDEKTVKTQEEEEVEDTTEGKKENEEAEVLAMAERVAVASGAAADEWPWAMRRALRALLDAAGVTTGGALSPLQQHMMATIIVLRGVVPALLAMPERLLPPESGFDHRRAAVQRRCMLLARLSLKSAHGLLFTGPQETAMEPFNAGLSRLADHWAEAFARLCAVDVVAPAARKVDQAEAAAVVWDLRTILALHMPRLAHTALTTRPLLEPLLWNRLLRLIQCRNLFPRMSSASRARSERKREDQIIYTELVAYGARAMADADAVTGLYADFCGLCGVTENGTVVFHVQGDLLDRYVSAFYATPRPAAALERYCPQFTHCRHRGPRDGDALAFLLLMLSSTAIAPAPSVHVLAVAGSSPLLRDDAWLRHGLQLLPSHFGVHIAIKRATDAAAAAAKLHVSLPLPPAEYLALRRSKGSGMHEEPLLWPAAAMRDVFEVVRTAVRPAGGSGITEQPMRGIAISATANFRVAAVELFARFDGDMLLHLEVAAGAKKPGSASWFDPSSPQQKQQCAQECIFSHAMLAAAVDLQSAKEESPSVILGMRHMSLQSLWMLLLYHLWKAFTNARRTSTRSGVIKAMAEALRAAGGVKLANEKRGGMRPESGKRKSENKADNEKEELHVAAVVLAAVSKTECELIQLLVALCAFVRLIDFEELGGARDEAVIDGVRRIILSPETDDEAELRVADLIALRGAALLEAAELSSWEKGLWSMPGLPP